MTKQYNVDIVGSLTNNNGVLGGFTSENYATFQAIAPGATFFESVFKFNCTDVMADSMVYHLGDWTQDYGCLSLEIYEGKFYLWFGSNNAGHFDINGTTTLQSNTDYWVKTTYDGSSNYNLYLSTDGENYTLEGSKSISGRYVKTNNTALSYIGGENYPFQGTIDLNKSYIVYGGSIWQGVTQVISSSEKKYNVGIIGNVINNNGVLSGFSGESDAVLNNTSQVPQGKDWEVNICATTGPDVSGWYGVITPFIDQHGMRIDICDSHFEFLFGDKTNGWYNVSAGYIASSYTVLPNTKYYLRGKCEVQSNKQLIYSFSYSLDGENYEVLLSYGNKTNMIPLDGYWLGGSLTGGSIDLNECYIKLNGAIVWRGAGYDTYNFEKDDTGNYTLKDNILSSPQEGILFKNTVTLPALVSSGANERDIVVFETSVKGQDVDPTYFACAWIGSNDLPTTQNFSDSYGFFRLENKQMQVGLASYNANNGQGEWHSKNSQSIDISSESFIDLRFEIFRYNNQLCFQASCKSAAELNWYGKGGSSFDTNRYYSEGGDYSALLFVRADNAEYVPYTDLTKTRILVNGNIVWQASEVSAVAPVPPTPVGANNTFEFVQKVFTLGVNDDEDTTSTFQFFKRGFIMGDMGSSPTPTPTWQDVVISGVGSLTLTKAKADGLNYLKLFGGSELLPEDYIGSVTLEGKCEQNGTPTPTVPVDIVCNNGAIRVGPNLANMIADNIAINKYINNSGVVSSDSANFYYQKPIIVKPNTTYTMHASISLRYFSVMEYSDYACTTFITRTLYGSSSTPAGDTIVFTTGSTTNSIYFGSNIYGGFELTIEAVQAINWMLTQTATAEDYVPYGQIYTDGTVETVTDSNQLTAMAQMLLSVRNYKDTQEVLSGVVTRNVGIKVLDGTENWQNISGYMNIAKTDLGSNSTVMPDNSTNIICSHFEPKTNVFVDGIGIGVSYVNFKYDSLFTTLVQFKQWLASQYSAGTPVILVYPTSSATTETVTGQFLSKSPVTTTGSLTGLVANVVSSAHTTPTPIQPLPINTNNGVLTFGTGNIYNTVDGQGTFVSPNASTTTRIYKAFGKLKAGKYYIKITGDFQFIFQYKDTIDTIPSQYGNIGTWTTEDVYEITDTSSYYGVAIRDTYNGNVSPSDFNNIGSIGYSYLDVTPVGTVETVEVDTTGDTATAEMLLKVGDYQDEQSVIDGEVTRNVGVKVLDGTENWRSVVTSKFYLDNDYMRNYNFMPVFCTHYKSVLANGTSGVGFGEIGLFASGSQGVSPARLVVGDDNYTSVNDFKAYLSQRYQAGMPVIVIYPLREPTTESVTAQPLTIQAGTNVIEVTQASIEDLSLEASYKAPV